MASNYSNVSESSGVHVVALSEDGIPGSSLSGRKPEELKIKSCYFGLSVVETMGKVLKQKLS